MKNFKLNFEDFAISLHISAYSPNYKGTNNTCFTLNIKRKANNKGEHEKSSEFMYACLTNVISSTAEYVKSEGNVEGIDVELTFNDFCDYIELCDSVGMLNYDYVGPWAGVKEKAEYLWFGHYDLDEQELCR